MNPSTASFDIAGRGFKPFITNSTPLKLWEIGTDPCSANQGYRGLPGFCPAVIFADFSRTGGSSQTSRHKARRGTLCPLSEVRAPSPHPLSRTSESHGHKQNLQF